MVFPVGLPITRTLAAGHLSESRPDAGRLESPGFAILLKVPSRRKSSEELATIRQRLEREDLTVLAYRFKGDCRAERFAAYAEALGDRFVARELPDSAANTDVPPFVAQYVRCPHSVVTVHLIDEAGQPTVAARDEILSFFARRLAPPV